MGERKTIKAMIDNESLVEMKLLDFSFYCEINSLFQIRHHLFSALVVS